MGYSEISITYTLELIESLDIEFWLNWDREIGYGYFPDLKLTPKSAWVTSTIERLGALWGANTD